MDYDAWFATVTGHEAAHPWQRALGDEAECRDRLVRIPTGLGKTQGVLLAWAWNRIMRQDMRWPTRLVWCLPMRVLVEQTAEVARSLFSALAQAGHSEAGDIGVYRLLGGAEVDPWHHSPEVPAVLVGTQDMLLSRALNRGYAAGRARWPVEYGLLNQDALWVMDEVQLMDVGLATSVQLQSFRRTATPLRPAHTWWMSATLQESWLRTVESEPWLPSLAESATRVPADQRTGKLFQARKPLALTPIPAAQDSRCQQIATAVLDVHRATLVSGPRLTLAIFNRVETARSVHAAVGRQLGDNPAAAELYLVHSRFRGMERRDWPARFLSREASESAGADRIIIATQVVEAGVDISATALLTELAPWASLVQRFGRAARYGGEAAVTVVDRVLSGPQALPYSETDLDAAREALARLDDVGLHSLETFEAELESDDPALIARLYPYEPLHVLTRRENDELFDTSPDLTGADLDVGRFIRSGKDRDLSVAWIAVHGDAAPTPSFQPGRDELCPVPVADARKWLFDTKGKTLRPGCLAWCWDYAAGVWRRPRPEDCRPGQILLVDAAWGGYHPLLGFTAERPTRKHPPIPLSGIELPSVVARADQAQARDDLSQSPWKTLAAHGLETGREVAAVATAVGLAPELMRLLDLAGRVHDLGKAHPAFVACIRDSSSEGERPERPDLAKAPQDAWLPLAELYHDPAHGPRRGFRHELASTLALFELLHRQEARHPALLGAHGDLIALGVLEPAEPEEPGGVGIEAGSLAKEISRLSAQQFDLLCHLVSVHHGKVRGAWQGTPHDQEFPRWNEDLVGSGQPLNGVREGDVLPSVQVYAEDGKLTTTPPLTLHLDPASLGLSPRYGSSWAERLHNLLRASGPFNLGYLEALVRAADIRASRLDTPDPLLTDDQVVV